MPKPVNKGVWTEFHANDKRYPEVWIVADEKPIAKFRESELDKFLKGFNEDIKTLRLTVEQNAESARYQKEYEARYGKD